MRRKNDFPPDWDEVRVRELITYYESQSEEVAVAEDEAVFEHPDTTMIEVPSELVPAVHELLDKRCDRPRQRRKSELRCLACS